MRTTIGLEVRDGGEWGCDLEIVTCRECHHHWYEVVAECPEWQAESRAAGRTLPYLFLEGGA